MALLALATLAGCGGMTADVETTPAAAPMRPPPAPAEVATKAPAEVAATTPAPAPAPERHYPAPETLKGLDAGTLSSLLGAPRFKRRDDPAEIWQYRTEACAFDVFLYRAGRGGTYTVRHFEARGTGLRPVEAKDCFVGLLKARERRHAG